jgi:hypothetical protein
MLIWEGDGMAYGLGPSDKGFHDGDQNAEHKKDEEDAQKLSLQGYLMHHIVVRL